MISLNLYQRFMAYVQYCRGGLMARGSSGFVEAADRGETAGIPSGFPGLVVHLAFAVLSYSAWPASGGARLLGVVHQFLGSEFQEAELRQHSGRRGKQAKAGGRCSPTYLFLRIHWKGKHSNTCGRSNVVCVVRLPVHFRIKCGSRIHVSSPNTCAVKRSN